MWLDDTPNATFLNVDLVNGAQITKNLTSADYYEHYRVELTGPAGGDCSVEPNNDFCKLSYFRLGWTLGFGNTGGSQTISLSRFGWNATR